MTREQFLAKYTERLYRKVLARVAYQLWVPRQVDLEAPDAEMLHQAGYARREQMSNGEYRYGLLAAYFERSF